MFEDAATPTTVPAVAPGIKARARHTFTKFSASARSLAVVGRSVRRFVAGSAVLGLGVAFSAGGHAQSRVVASPPATVQATTPAVIQAVLTQFKVVKSKDGVEKLEDASKVNPGDVIEYQVTYKNNGNKAVAGMTANLPIPPGLEYQPGSAKPGNPQVKVAAADGAYAAEPLTRNIAGKTEKLPYKDYRSIRWTLGDLPAHGITTVTARAQVEKLAPPAAITPVSTSPENNSRMPAPSVTR